MHSKSCTCTFKAHFQTSTFVANETVKKCNGFPQQPNDQISCTDLSNLSIHFRRGQRMSFGFDRKKNVDFDFGFRDVDYFGTSVGERR